MTILYLHFSEIYCLRIEVWLFQVLCFDVKQELLNISAR